MVKVYRGGFLVAFEDIKKIESDLIQVGDQIKGFKRICFPTTSVLINIKFIETYYKIDGEELHIFVLKNAKCELRGNALRFIFEVDGKEDSGFSLTTMYICSVYHREAGKLIFSNGEDKENE